MNKTKAQRRLAIVRDALAQLRKGLYKTGDHGYVNFPFNTATKHEEDGKTILRALSKPCGVCALGSMLLSSVRKENTYSVGDVVNDTCGGSRRNLRKLWPDQNLDLVERFYEGWPNDAWGKQIAAFEIKFPEETGAYMKRDARLTAILKNMLKHGGLFKPSKRAK
jgi:hypothetical protein